MYVQMICYRINYVWFVIILILSIASRRLLDFSKPRNLGLELDSFIGEIEKGREKISRSIKRRLQDSYSYDVTTGNTGDRPCIIMEIKLETENLVPTNTEPDPASNIYLIGKALANITGGSLTFPDIPDDEDDLTENMTNITNATTTTNGNIEYDAVWEIPDECQDGTQIDDAYWVCFYVWLVITFVCYL